VADVLQELGQGLEEAAGSPPMGLNLYLVSHAGRLPLVWIKRYLTAI
jgi:hypothetical protein